jgi:hypothetical protein
VTFTIESAYRYSADATVGVVLAVAIIGFSLRHELDAPRRWLVAWLAADAIASLAAVVLRIVIRNNQYVAQSWYPISAALAIAVVASTISSPKQRKLVWAAAVAVAALIVALTIRVEVFGDFSRFTGAIHGLSIAAVGSTLVVQRALRARGDMLTDPIFLIGVAFLLIGTPSAFLSLAVRQLRERERDWRLMVFALKNGVTLVAYLLMVVALRSRSARTAMPLATGTR